MSGEGGGGGGDTSIRADSSKELHRSSKSLGLMSWALNWAPAGGSSHRLGDEYRFPPPDGFIEGHPLRPRTQGGLSGTGSGVCTWDDGTGCFKQAHVIEGQANGWCSKILSATHNVTHGPSSNTFRRPTNKQKKKSNVNYVPSSEQTGSEHDHCSYLELPAALSLAMPCP